MEDNLIQKYHRDEKYWALFGSEFKLKKKITTKTSILDNVMDITFQAQHCYHIDCH